MNKFFSELKKISIFGKDLQFEKDYNNKFVSLSSLILTIFVIIFTIIVGFIFGKEIYERKTPKFTSSKSPVSFENTKFFIQDMPILLNFRTKNVQPISDETIRKVLSFKLSLLTFHDGIGKFTEKEIKKCNVNEFKNKEYEKLLEKEFSVPDLVYYCISPDEYVQSKRGATESQVLNIIVDKCIGNCLPNIDNFVEGMYAAFSYLNSYVDPFDYNNPIKYYFEKFPIRLNNKLSKEITYSFTKNTLLTNKGWIFSDSKIQHYVTYDNVLRDVFLSDTNLLNIFIDSPTLVYYTTREYMKIQDLLANIGGFFNATYLILSFVFTNMLKFEYYVYIHNKHTEFSKEIKKIDENPNPKNVLVNNYLGNIRRDNNLNSLQIAKKRTKQDNQITKKNNSEHLDENENNTSNKKINVNLENNRIEQSNRREDRNISEESNRNVNLNLDENQNNLSLKRLEEIEINSSKNDINDEDISYLNYIYNDIICCRNNYSKVLENSQTLLSFDNFMNVAFKHNG